MNELRPYQDQDYLNVKKALDEVDRVIYQLPTGGGKTVVIGKIVDDFMEEGHKFLIIVHKEKLLRQMVLELKSRGLWVGHIIRDEKVNLDARVIVASVSTVMGEKRINMIKDRTFDYIVIDEAHHAVTDSFNKVVKAANQGNPCKILGVTATPYRSDNKNLGDFFDKLVLSSKTMTELIEEGYLCKYKIFYTPVSNLKATVGRSGNDYKIRDLSIYMREPHIIQYLVDSYKNFAENRKMICFCVDIKHAKSVQQAYINNGYTKTAYIDSGTKPEERESIFRGFRGQDINIIVCIETLTEGIDLPECNAVQLARPTLSLILYLQFVGRGLRPKPDGGNCIILDNAGLTEEFRSPDSPRNWTLDSSKDPTLKSEKVLVRVKSNGSIDEDIESGDGLEELIEMDPEEYILKRFGSVEEAEEHNKNNRIRFQKTILDICKEILDKTKTPGVVTISKYDDIKVSINGKEIMEFKLQKGYDNEEDILFALASYEYGLNSSRIDKNKYSNSLLISSYVGIINIYILNHLETISFNLNKLREIKKKEINIVLLKNKIENANKNLVKLKLIDCLNHGINEFSFEGDNLKPYQLKSGVYGNVTSITFQSNNFNMKNNLFVKSTDQRGYDNSFTTKTEAEKILSIFSNYDFNKVKNVTI